MRTRRVIERRKRSLMLAVASPGIPFAVFVAPKELPYENAPLEEDVATEIERHRHREHRYSLLM